MLVHGLGARRALWKRVAPELAREFTVFSFDLRGTGESERPAGPYSLDDFVSDLRGVIEECELERPALVGHSFGGSIVLRYAAEHPGDVSSVVSIAGPVRLPDQARQGMRDRADTVETRGMVSIFAPSGTFVRKVQYGPFAPSALQMPFVSALGRFDNGATLLGPRFCLRHGGNGSGHRLGRNQRRG